MSDTSFIYLWNQLLPVQFKEVTLNIIAFFEMMKISVKMLVFIECYINMLYNTMNFISGYDCLTLGLQ